LNQTERFSLSRIRFYIKPFDRIHFAEFPVSEKKSPFPDNVKKTAEVNDVKLITTVELFEIAKDIIDGKMERTQAIEKILDLTKKA